MNDRRPHPTSYPPPYPGPYHPPAAQRPPGAQPGPWPGPPAPTPPAGPPPRRKGRIVFRILAVAILAVIGFAINSGRAARTNPARPIPSLPAAAAPSTSVAPVTLSAFDLQAGDCYTAAPLPADGTTRVIRSVQSVPCTQPHTAQVVAVPGYAGRSYDEVINTVSVADCAGEFRAKLPSTVLSDKRYQLGRIYPDALAWSRSPSVACVVATDAPITGSVSKG